MSRTLAKDRQRWERKFQESGARIVTLRLSPAAMAVLNLLCCEFDCNRKEAIEGLLLGSITGSTAHAKVAHAMQAFGASREEAAAMVPHVPRGTLG